MAKRAKSKSRSFYIEALKSRGAKGRLSKMKKAELEKLYHKTMPGTEHGEDHDGPKTDHDGQQGDGDEGAEGDLLEPGPQLRAGEVLQRAGLVPLVLDGGDGGVLDGHRRVLTSGCTATEP